MPKHPTLWLTRPREDSESFAKELAKHTITSLIAPVMRIVRQPFTPPVQRPDAILLTSRHAAHALAILPSEWRDLPVYCVGSATAAIASELNCRKIIPGASHVLALLPQIAADLREGTTLLYLAGEDVSVDIVPLLAIKDISVETHAVYRALADTSLAPDLQAQLTAGSIDGVAFFSARSAEITAKLITQAGLTESTRTIHAYCLSLHVANAAGALPWAAIHACHQPTRASMREMIVSTLANS